MGQTHAKAITSHDEAQPPSAIGPGSASTHSADVKPPSVPPQPSPPLSGPTTLRPPRNEVFDVGDQRSYHSKKSIGSGPKQIARKLSTRTKLSAGSSRPARPSVESQMKAFEALVAAAELSAGIESPSLSRTPVKGSPLSSRKPRHQSSQVHISHEPPASAPPVPTGAPSSPIAGPTIPRRASRPVLSRWTSSGSTKSGRASAKSSCKAEKEWRAKVAAIAYASSIDTDSEAPQHRGPVPPKRTPALARATSGDRLPESDANSPPAQHAPASDALPARMSMSNQSFRTLGHHAARTPSTVRLGRESSATHKRQASVPRSVLSSTYSDPLLESSAPTVPSFLVPSHALGDGRVDNGPLRHATSASQLDLHAAGSSSRNRDTPKISLSPCQLAEVPPHRTQTTPARKPLSPALPESAARPSQAAASLDKISPAPTDAVKVDLRLNVSITKTTPAERYNTAPSRSEPDVLNPGGDASRTPLSPSPRPAGSTDTARLSTGTPPAPSTPVSPMTAFFMTAPLDTFNIGTYTFDSPAKQNLHPYSVNKPVQPASPSSPTAAIVSATTRRIPFPSSPDKSPIDSAPAPHTSFGPFSPPPKKVTRKTAVCRGVAARRPSVLQAKKTQPTASALGSGYDSKGGRSELERQRQVLKKMGVDLTPGMESGHRPPKSGLPRDVSVGSVE